MADSRHPLAVLQQTLAAQLSSIAGMEYCGPLPKRRDQVTLPALFLDMVELEPSNDPGTSELGLISHWEGRILVSEQNTDTVLWGLVQAVMVWLHQFHCAEENIGPAKLKQAVPDNFSPDYPGHKMWLAEWTHVLRVGNNIWNSEGVIPSTLLVNEQIV